MSKISFPGGGGGGGLTDAIIEIEGVDGPIVDLVEGSGIFIDVDLANDAIIIHAAPTGGGGSAGVTTMNGLSGIMELIGSSGIQIATSGTDKIIIDQTVGVDARAVTGDITMGTDGAYSFGSLAARVGSGSFVLASGTLVSGVNIGAATQMYVSGISIGDFLSPHVTELFTQQSGADLMPRASFAASGAAEKPVSSGTVVGAGTDLYVSGISVGDFLSVHPASIFTHESGAQLSDHGSLDGLTDDDHAQYLIGDYSRMSNYGRVASGVAETGMVIGTTSGAFGTAGAYVFVVAGTDGTSGILVRRSDGRVAVGGTETFSSVLTVAGDGIISFPGAGKLDGATNLTFEDGGGGSFTSFTTSSFRINNSDAGALFNIVTESTSQDALTIRAITAQTSHLLNFEGSGAGNPEVALIDIAGTISGTITSGIDVGASSQMWVSGIAIGDFLSAHTTELFTQQSGADLLPRSSFAASGAAEKPVTSGTVVGAGTDLYVSGISVGDFLSAGGGNPIDSRAATGDVVPNASGTLDLGSVSAPWRAVRALSGIFGSGTVTIDNDSILMSGVPVINATNTSGLVVGAGTDLYVSGISVGDFLSAHPTELFTQQSGADLLPRSEFAASGNAGGIPLSGTTLGASSQVYISGISVGDKLGLTSAVASGADVGAGSQLWVSGVPVGNFLSPHTTELFTQQSGADLLPRASFETSGTAAGYLKKDGSVAQSGVLFDTGYAPAHEEGLLFYDSATTKALSFYNDEADITLNIGQELYIPVRNDTGATITNGQVVRILNATTSYPSVEPAIANDREKACDILGFATHDIEDNTVGYVASFGLVRGINTSSFSDGDEVFLDASTSGAYTATQPKTPNYLIKVGYVIDAAVNGSILVDVDGRINTHHIQIRELSVASGIRADDQTLTMAGSGYVSAASGSFSSQAYVSGTAIGDYLSPHTTELFTQQSGADLLPRASFAASGAAEKPVSSGTVVGAGTDLYVSGISVGDFLSAGGGNPIDGRAATGDIAMDTDVAYDLGALTARVGSGYFGEVSGTNVRAATQIYLSGTSVGDFLSVHPTELFTQQSGADLLPRASFAASGAAEKPTSSGTVVGAGTDLYVSGISVGDFLSAHTSDHGALTGKDDDDHTQYLLMDGARTEVGTTSMSGVFQAVSGTFDDELTVSGISVGDFLSVHPTALFTQQSGIDLMLRADFAASGAAAKPTTSGTVVGAGTDIYISGISVGDFLSAHTSDHGALTGKDDDDHTQYLLMDGARTEVGTTAMSGRFQAISGIFDDSLTVSGVSVGDFLSPHPTATPVDARAATGDIEMDTDGAYNLGAESARVGSGVFVLASGTTVAAGTDLTVSGVSVGDFLSPHSTVIFTHQSGADLLPRASFAASGAAEKPTSSGTVVGAGTDLYVSGISVGDFLSPHVTDHGALTGLVPDNDHPQYSLTADFTTSGDARYFRENEHITNFTGPTDEGKPIVLNADGKITAALLESGVGGGTTIISTPVALTSYVEASTKNTEQNIHGGAVELVAGGAISSGSPLSLGVKGVGKFFLVVNAGSDTTGTITVNGRSVDRNTGEEVEDDTSTITLAGLSTDNTNNDGGGHHIHKLGDVYFTSKWYRGLITLTTTDVNLSDVDVWHCSFEQWNDHTDYTLTTFDINTQHSNFDDGEVYAHLHIVKKQEDGRFTVSGIADLSIEAGSGEANQQQRLRAGNINQAMSGSTDGIFIDMYFDNRAFFYTTTKVWASMKTDVAFNLDHGLMSGILDDDHTQYLLRSDFASSGAAAKPTTSGTVVGAGTNLYVSGISVGDFLSAHTVDTTPVDSRAATGNIIPDDDAQYTLGTEAATWGSGSFTLVSGVTVAGGTSLTVSGVEVGDFLSAHTSDHGALAGKDDDDHTQYLLMDGARTEVGTTAMSGRFQAISGLFDDGLTVSGVSVGDFLSPHVASGANIGAGTQVWVSGIGIGDFLSAHTSDHGALTGRDDDDHTQYLLMDGARTEVGTTAMSGRFQAISGLFDAGLTVSGVSVGDFLSPHAAADAVDGRAATGDIDMDTDGAYNLGTMTSRVGSGTFVLASGTTVAAGTNLTVSGIEVGDFLSAGGGNPVDARAATGDITPDANAQYTLGTAAATWGSGVFTLVSGVTVNAATTFQVSGSDMGPRLRPESAVVSIADTQAEAFVEGGTANPASGVNVGASTQIYVSGIAVGDFLGASAAVDFSAVAEDIIPDSSGARNIGTMAKPWNSGFFNRMVVYSSANGSGWYLDVDANGVLQTTGPFQP